MGKLIKRIPVSCLLISTLPGSALRTHVELLAINWISKDTQLVFYIYMPAENATYHEHLALFSLKDHLKRIELQCYNLLLLSCQPRVTVTSCIVYKFIRDL